MATLDLAGRGYYSGIAGTIAALGYIEPRAQIIRSLVASYEAIRATPLVQVDASARSRDIATYGYYGGITTILATAGFRTQQQKIVSDFALDLAAVKNLNSDHTALFDIRANIGLIIRDQVFYYDARSAVTRPISIPFDSVSAIVRDMPSAFEAVFTPSSCLDLC